jgi:hypothetical protein
MWRLPLDELDELVELDDDEQTKDNSSQTCAGRH